MSQYHLWNEARLRVPFYLSHRPAGDREQLSDQGRGAACAGNLNCFQCWEFSVSTLLVAALPLETGTEGGQARSNVVFHRTAIGGLNRGGR